MQEKRIQLNKYICLFFILVVSMFFFCGCQLFDGVISNGGTADQNTNENTGRDAYEIAVENGFVGTEAEWLETLKGESAYEIAVRNGFVGTEAEWIASLQGNGDSSVAPGTSTSEPADNLTTVINKTLKSTVLVTCPFTYLGNEVSSAGSGVFYIINKESGIAYIITNFHVVYNSNLNKINDVFYVSPYGYSDLMTAEYVGGSSTYDIAILKVQNELIKSENFKTVEFSKLDYTVVGQTAIAVGNAEGSGLSVTQGIVCVDSEYIDLTTSDTGLMVSQRVLRIDTAVNPGNSGGGLFNEKGVLIGIVNAKIIDNKVEGIGYAIPSSLALKVAKNILAGERFGRKEVAKPLLGITITIASSKAVFNEETDIMKIEEAIVVHSVEPTSLLNGLLEIGDVICEVQINGLATKVDRMYKLTESLLEAEEGDIVTFKFLRAGAEMQQSITISAAMITYC